MTALMHEAGPPVQPTLAAAPGFEYVGQGMTSGGGISWLAVGLAVLGVAAAPARVSGKEKSAPCMRLQGERQVRGEVLCEDVFSCFRPPGEAFDRIGLRRLAFCDAAGGPVVLFLPGVHMNGEIAGTDANYDLRLYLAQAGIRTWSLDYRTHAVPSQASSKELDALDDWGRDLFADDAEWAATFVRSTDPGPLYLAGFGFGGTMAYAVAARGAQPIQGLIVLDGVPGGAGVFRGESGGGPAIDVAGTRLPYPDRERLLRAAARDPAGPSPIGGYASAGAALADIAFSASEYGGSGALSAAKDGVSDPRALARLLQTFDRWWPREALRGSEPKAPKRTLPVLAFASGNLGSMWVERVQEGAAKFGGDRAVLQEMPLHGHLDLLVGKLASSEVYEPIRLWLLGPK